MNDPFLPFWSFTEKNSDKGNCPFLKAKRDSLPSPEIAEEIFERSDETFFYLSQTMIGFFLHSSYFLTKESLSKQTFWRKIRKRKESVVAFSPLWRSAVCTFCTERGRRETFRIGKGRILAKMWFFSPHIKWFLERKPYGAFFFFCEDSTCKVFPTRISPRLCKVSLSLSSAFAKANELSRRQKCTTGRCRKKKVESAW